MDLEGFPLQTQKVVAGVMGATEEVTARPAGSKSLARLPILGMS